MLFSLRKKFSETGIYTPTPPPFLSCPKRIKKFLEEKLTIRKGAGFQKMLPGGASPNLDSLSKFYKRRIKKKY